MAVARSPELTLGPVFFNWQAEKWRDFYFRIADEAPFSTVYLGETICSKRTPLFDHVMPLVIERLRAAGKIVVISTLAEVTSDKDRKCVEAVCDGEGFTIEANDASALRALRGRAHHIGPFINAYNEVTLSFLANNGAQNICLPPEMPETAIQTLCANTNLRKTSIEVIVFGRLPLALSARCYHARAHGRTKDSCQFVCEDDPDGLDLTTLSGQNFLSVNGIQTLSYEYLNLANDLTRLREHGVSRFRLSPHTCDMVQAAKIFRRILDEDLDGVEATSQLHAILPQSKFCNGFYHHKPGHRWIEAPPPESENSAMMRDTTALA